MSTVVGQLEIQMMANVARATTDIKKFSRDTLLALEEVKRGAEMAKGALEMIGVGIGAVAFVEGIKGTIEMARKLEDLSQQLGMSVKDIAGYRLAAAETGTTLEAVATGVKKLSVFMVDHNDLMQQAGITASNANDGLLQLSDVFKALPDGVEKTALAVKLFGRGGLEMIPMLNEGSEKLQEQKKKTEALAAEYEKLAPHAKELNEQVSLLKMYAEAASISIASTFVPALTELAKGFTEAAAKGELFGKTLKTDIEMAGWLAKKLTPIPNALIDLAVRGGTSGIDNARSNGNIKSGQEILDAMHPQNAEAGTSATAVAAAHKVAQTLLGQADAGKQLKAVRDELLKQSEQWLAALDKETASLADQIAKEQDHIANLGLTKEQQDALAASKIDLEASAKREEAANLAAAAAYAGPLHDAYVQAATDIRAQADQLTKLAGLKREAAVKDVALEEQKKLQEQIKKNNEEWKRFTDQIETSLTDALMRGFEGGKNAGQNFIDSLKHTLETAALKIAVQAVVSPIMQGVQSVFGGSPGIGGGSAGGGAGGLLNLVSNGSSIYNAISGSGLLAAGNFATSSLGTAFGLSTATAAGYAAPVYASALEGGALLSAGTGTAAGGLTAAGGAFSALGAAVPYIGAALAIGGALGLFGGGGEDPHNNPDSKTIAAKLGMGGAMAPYNYASAFGSAGPTYVVSGQTSGRGRWADHPGLSAQDLSGLNSGVSSLFASGHSIASTLGIDPSVINDASVQSENFASAQDALSQLGDVIATKLVPNIRQFQIAGQTLFQTLQTDVAAVKALRDQFDAFKNQLALGDLSTLDPLSKYRMAKDLYNKALTGTDSNAVMQAGQQFLQASRSAFASSASYAADYNNVMSTVTNFENKAVQYPWQAAATTTDTSHAAANVAVSQAGFQALIAQGLSQGQTLNQILATLALNATNPNLAKAA